MVVEENARLRPRSVHIKKITLEVFLVREIIYPKSFSYGDKGTYGDSEESLENADPLELWPLALMEVMPDQKLLLQNPLSLVGSLWVD